MTNLDLSKHTLVSLCFIMHDMINKLVVNRLLLLNLFPIRNQLTLTLFFDFRFFHDFFRPTRPIWPRFWPNSKLSLIHVFRRVFLGLVAVVRNSGLRPQYYILTLQRMFKSTSSGYRVDKLGYVSCIRPLKIFCRSLGHIGPVVLDKTLKYRKIIMQICLPIGKKQPGRAFRYMTAPVCSLAWRR